MVEFFDIENVSRETFCGSLYKKKGQLYSDVIMCFDIETTSAFIKNDKVIPFDFSKNGKFYEPLEKVSLCYIWQFSIGSDVYYGRQLEDFQTVLNILHDMEDVNFIIWVHNLAMEFQFLRNIVTFDSVFAKSTHRPMYARVKNVEFRCSYFLTGLSLENWAKFKKLPVTKAVGELDYNLIRTPLTVMSVEEMDYAERDCLVMYEGLKQYLLKYNHLVNIPLTKTGEVRRDVKNLFKGDHVYHRAVTSLLPQSVDEYVIQKLVFTGGCTHGNWLKVGAVEENVWSFDKASDYPWAMATKKYPMRPFRKCVDWEDKIKGGYAVILEIEFYRLQSTNAMSFISNSKCVKISSKKTIDNGKVLACEYAKMFITEVDFKNISRLYKWGKIVVLNAWSAKKGYLPKKYIEYILFLYEKKVTLKGTEAEETGEYQAFKELLNSLYGLMVTALLHEDIIFSENEWKPPVSKSFFDIEKALEELKEKEYKNTLSYWWGVYVTAYGREALADIITVTDCDTRYCDTDSVKGVGDYDWLFEEYNKKILNEIAEVSKTLNIPIEKFIPKTISGVEKPLGVFEKEKDCPYQEFKYLGAKRYAYRDKNGELHLTCSGVNKKAGVKALKNDIENLREGMTFSYEEAKKLLLHYLDNQPTVTFKEGEYDEFKSEYKYGICMQPTTYNMTLAEDFIILLSHALDFSRDLAEMSDRELYEKMLEYNRKER